MYIIGLTPTPTGNPQLDYAVRSLLTFIFQVAAFLG